MVRQEGAVGVIELDFASEARRAVHKRLASQTTRDSQCTLTIIYMCSPLFGGWRDELRELRQAQHVAIYEVSF